MQTNYHMQSIRISNRKRLFWNNTRPLKCYKCSCELEHSIVLSRANNKHNCTTCAISLSLVEQKTVDDFNNNMNEHDRSFVPCGN